MGRRYLAFAAEDPLGYRLMFGTPWPALAEELGLVHDARHALDVLSTMLRRIHGNDRAMRTPVDRGALFIWLQMRGLASIAQANVMQHLGMTLQAGRQMVWHATNVLELAIVAAGTTSGSMGWSDRALKVWRCAKKFPPPVEIGPGRVSSH